MRRRLPERFQNRWGYAGAAFLTAAVTPWIIFVFLGVIFGLKFVPPNEAVIQPYNWVWYVEYTFRLAIPAAISAILCWPNVKLRSQRRMAIAGVLTVILTIILICICFEFEAPKPFKLYEFIGETGAWILGISFFSLGIPHVMAVIVSKMFVSRPKAEAPHY